MINKLIEKKVLARIGQSSVIINLQKTRKMLAYRVSFKNFIKKHTKLNLRVSSSYSKRIDEYWKNHYGKKVNKYWHAVCSSITGIEEERYIPNDIFAFEILPHFNREKMYYVYSDKNRADIFLDGYNAPRTVYKKMNGYYYFDKYQMTTMDIAREHLYANDKTMFIKPSFLAAGEMVAPLNIKNKKLFLNNKPASIEEIDELYGDDYIIQEKIEQHPLMSEVYPHSLNTLRMVTLRLKNTTHLLFISAKFGNGGNKIDNISAGGLQCRVFENGQLDKIATDKYGRIYDKHPYTRTRFQDITIPNMNKFKDHVIELHKCHPYFNYACWDIAVGSNAEPVFVETNFRGGDIMLFQLISGPLFGDLTDAILENIRDNRKNK